MRSSILGEAPRLHQGSLHPAHDEYTHRQWHGRVAHHNSAGHLASKWEGLVAGKDTISDHMVITQPVCLWRCLGLLHQRCPPRRDTPPLWRPQHLPRCWNIAQCYPNLWTNFQGPRVHWPVFMAGCFKSGTTAMECISDCVLLLDLPTLDLEVYFIGHNLLYPWVLTYLLPRLLMSLSLTPMPQHHRVDCSVSAR